jgi:hypothetical protein
MATRSPTVAVPFVVYNDSAKKYEVTEQSIKILEALPDKIGAWKPVTGHVVLITPRPLRLLRVLELLPGMSAHVHRRFLV